MSKIVAEEEIARNVDKYLDISAAEDVYITRKGRIIAVLTKPERSREEVVEEMRAVGICGEENEV